MILNLDDWVFDVDVSATMEYSAQEAAGHCDCAYCRNFYAAVDSAYPNLRPFLAQFGLDAEGPDELMPFEPTNVLCCYGVEGRIIRKGEQAIHVDGIAVYAEDANDAKVNTGCRSPYFILSIGPMELPWVLEEDKDGVESTANEPSFFRKMLRRFLRLADRSGPVS